MSNAEEIRGAQRTGHTHVRSDMNSAVDELHAAFAAFDGQQRVT